MANKLGPFIFCVSRALICFTLLGRAQMTAAADLFVSSFNQTSIERFDSQGTHTHFASGAISPEGLAFDKDGNLFQAAMSVPAKIYKYTPDGSQSVFATNVIQPLGLAFDAAGYLFVADNGGGNILRYDPQGNSTVFASGLDSPYGLAFDASGNLFSSRLNSTNGQIFKFAPDGTKSVFASGLDQPLGLAFDASGNLYEADNGSGYIYKFTPAGVKTMLAFVGALPRGLAVDDSGNVFVAVPQYVKTVSPSGVVDIFTSLVPNPTFLTFQNVQIQKPALSISRLGLSQAIISWPVKFGGFVLQQSFAIDLDSWSVTPLAQATNSTSFWVTVPVTSTNFFYRLSRP